jgi:hypothetical protein
MEYPKSYMKVELTEHQLAMVIANLRYVRAQQGFFAPGQRRLLTHLEATQDAYLNGPPRVGFLVQGTGTDGVPPRYAARP